MVNQKLNQFIHFIKSLSVGPNIISKDIVFHRQLTESELLVCAYYELKRWTNNDPAGESTQLQTIILEQFAKQYPEVLSSEPLDANFDWVVQEYICAESADYSFGVFK